MASSKDVASILKVIVPLVEGFTTMAESSGSTGQEKHDAVAEAVEKSFGALKDSGKVSELSDVDYELVKPLIEPVGNGLISVGVALMKRLGIFVSKKLND